VDKYNEKCRVKKTGGKILDKGSLKSFKTKIYSLRQYLSYFPIFVIALLVIGGNLKDKASGFYFSQNLYSQEEIERFVGLVSPFTPNLEEEPSLVGLALASDNFVASEGILEKPQIALTQPAPAPEPQEQPKQPERKGIITYTVLAGDTVSGIAKKHGISLKTLADSNNLSSVHKIKPGDTLSIPPIDGLVVTVAKGDTISALVKKYQGDLATTLKYNSENLTPGDRVVVASGKLPAPAPTPQPTKLAKGREVVARGGRVSGSTSGKRLAGAGSSYNGYPWGWCTWYAAYRRNVPRQWGNAGRWLSSARAAGYATGSEPQAGAIIVTRERWPLGHVGYVESVSGDSVTISEMNYKGFGIISSRTISRGSSIIIGYIY